VATSADEQADITAQLDLLEKKKRLVTKGASSGLQSALRNALFLANPEQLQEEELFDANGGVSPLVAVELAAAPAPKAAKKPAATPLYKMMQSMRAGAAEQDLLVAGDLLPLHQQQQQAKALQQPTSSAPSPFMLPAATGFNSFSAVHQDQLLLQQQMAQHMAQMAMHQQLQMNTYMSSAAPVAAPVAVAPAPVQYSYDPMFDATPFDELAELLGMGDASDAALAGLQLPVDFDEDFMMMMETCASGELDEPMVPAVYQQQQVQVQQLPLTMQTGHAVLQQQQQQQYQQFNAAPYMQMQMGWTV
jgi:hypothetical protein